MPNSDSEFKFEMMNGTGLGMVIAKGTAIGTARPTGDMEMFNNRLAAVQNELDPGEALMTMPLVITDKDEREEVIRRDIDKYCGLEGEKKERLLKEVLIPYSDCFALHEDELG